MSVLATALSRTAKQRSKKVSLWRRYLEESERPWLQLLTVLVTVLILLVSVVAYRLQMEGWDMLPPWFAGPLE
jgi:hypothetical protein